MSNAIASVEHRESTVIVRAAGELARLRSPEFHAQLLDIVSAKPARLIVDLSAVTFMDSSGLGSLLEVYKRLKRTGGRITLTGVVHPVRGVFEVTRMDKFFEIRATVEEALGP